MKTICFFFLFIIGCTQQLTSESKIVHNYLSLISEAKICSGNIILIDSKGCHGCIEKGLNFLEQNNLYDRYKILVISKKASELFGESVNKKKFVIDEDDLIERLNISHSGFVVIKITKSNIDTIFSLNPETNLNILKEYQAEMSLFHAQTCESCVRE